MHLNTTVYCTCTQVLYIVHICKLAYKTAYQLPYLQLSLAVVRSCWHPGAPGRKLQGLPPSTAGGDWNLQSHVGKFHPANEKHRLAMQTPTLTLPLHTAPSHPTYTQHTHTPPTHSTHSSHSTHTPTQCTHFTYTQHIHTPPTYSMLTPTHSTLTLPLHTARSFLHTAHSHSPCTQHAHSYTQHTHTPLAHSTLTHAISSWMRLFRRVPSLSHTLVLAM